VSVFICLILDKECRVLKAATLEALKLSRAVSQATRESGKLKGWGFELWQRGKRVHASYDCHAPPARRGSFSGEPRLAS